MAFGCGGSRTPPLQQVVFGGGGVSHVARVSVHGGGSAASLVGRDAKPKARLGRNVVVVEGVFVDVRLWVGSGEFGCEIMKEIIG